MTQESVCGPAYSPEVKRRCEYLSILTEGLAVVLLVVGTVFLLGIARAASNTGLHWTGGMFTTLVLVWIVWVALYVANAMLVRCGNQAVRIRYSPRLINRPDFHIRLAFHILVNWSAVSLTLLAAAVTEDQSFAKYLANLTIWTTIVLWVSFNLQHRRMNRARNLYMTLTIALSIIALSWLTLVLRH